MSQMHEHIFYESGRCGQGKAPKFLTIYNYHQLSVFSLFLTCRIHPLLIQAMLAEVAVPRSVAEQVIVGVNTLTGASYTLDDVRVALFDA